MIIIKINKLNKQISLIQERDIQKVSSKQG